MSQHLDAPRPRLISSTVQNFSPFYVFSPCWGFTAGQPFRLARHQALARHLVLARHFVLARRLVLARHPTGAIPNLRRSPSSLCTQNEVVRRGDMMPLPSRTDPRGSLHLGPHRSQHERIRARAHQGTRASRHERTGVPRSKGGRTEHRQSQRQRQRQRQCHRLPGPRTPHPAPRTPHRHPAPASRTPHRQPPPDAGHLKDDGDILAIRGRSRFKGG